MQNRQFVIHISLLLSYSATYWSAEELHQRHLLLSEVRSGHGDPLMSYSLWATIMLCPLIEWTEEGDLVGS